MPDIIERLQPSLADRYLIVRELGRGGMATVFLANDVKHDREVAVKVLHPELSASIGGERFEREIKLAARLQHPHILGLYDSGQAAGLLYYVMPFVKGESLRDRLDREGQLPIEDAIQLILEVADALGHAHSQGIVHRDIKPENVLISNGHALVADFGIARAAQEAGGHKLTQTGMAVGTPVYMSPEQAVGDPVGPTSDIYSLGCMLYELLAGEPPFAAKNAQALMARHAMEAVPSIRIVRSTVPEEVEDAIYAAMAKVPADRPKDAAHFAELLGMPLGSTMTRRAAIRQTASRRVPSGVYRMPRRGVPWWRKPSMLVAALVVLGVGAFTGWKVLGWSRDAAAGKGDLARGRRIAVLYFSADSSDPDLRPVADGLTESLIKSLSSIQGLTVSSRNAVSPYRGTEVELDSIGSIGRALDVGTVIEGSLERDGPDKVRLTTRLYDGSGADLGKRTRLVIRRDSLFAAGESIAGKVSESLREILGDEIRLRESQASAGNLRAWTLLQRGEKLRKDAELEALRDPTSAAPLIAAADSLLASATVADPLWVDPIVLRGELALQRSRIEPDKMEKGRWVEAGLGFAGEALKLEGDNARALALRGTLRYQQWGLAITPDPAARADLLNSAESDLQSAVNADPTLASAYATLSNVQYTKKDVYSALTMAKNAYAADRFLSNSAAILGRLFFASYDTEAFAEARKWCDEGGRRFPRALNFTLCQLLLGLQPDSRPDVTEAWRLAARLDSLAPPATRAYQSRLAQILVAGALGKKIGDTPSPLADSARRVLNRARADAAIDPRHELPGYEAVARARIGDLDEAIALLKQYVAFNPDHSFEVAGNIHWWWRELRSKRGFQDLLNRRR